MRAGVPSSLQSKISENCQALAIALLDATSWAAALVKLTRWPVKFDCW